MFSASTFFRSCDKDIRHARSDLCFNCDKTFLCDGRPRLTDVMRYCVPVSIHLPPFLVR